MGFEVIARTAPQDVDAIEAWRPALISEIRAWADPHGGEPPRVMDWDRAYARRHRARFEVGGRRPGWSRSRSEAGTRVSRPRAFSRGDVVAVDGRAVPIIATTAAATSTSGRARATVGGAARASCAATGCRAALTGCTLLPSAVRESETRRDDVRAALSDMPRSHRHDLEGDPSGAPLCWRSGREFHRRQPSACLRHDGGRPATRWRGICKDATSCVSTNHDKSDAAPAV